MQGTLAERACCSGGDSGHFRLHQTGSGARSRWHAVANSSISFIYILIEVIVVSEQSRPCVCSCCREYLLMNFHEGVGLRLRWRRGRQRYGWDGVKRFGSSRSFRPPAWRVKSFLSLRWNNTFPLAQIIIFRWPFKLVDFYLHIFSSNLFPFKWAPGIERPVIMTYPIIEEILAHL